MMPTFAVTAKPDGELVVDKRFGLAVHDGRMLRAPRADELVPLPRGSDFFLLPGRGALGLDPRTGQARPILDRQGRPALGASAFLAPAWLRFLHPAYHNLPGAPPLPLFAYAPLGWQEGRYVTCGMRVDLEPRQDPWRFPLDRIRARVNEALRAMPKNRLVRHLSHCALTYGCRAAQNYFLGRWEAPLPTARACNSSCLGCLSFPTTDGVQPSHQRIAFTPTAEEVAQVALTHSARVPNAVVSFGQGCEGEPLLNPALLVESVERIRARDQAVTINLNSNASRPQVVADLFKVGLSSLRVSLNSVREEPYNAYFKPRGYSFADLWRSVDAARAAGGFVSLNYFTFPGFTDLPAEAAALADRLADGAIHMIQWRNLNVDPDLYRGLLPPEEGQPLGLRRHLEALRARFPALRYGYFNPWVPPRA
jgi:pyruvate-formate lyase-activating enzyme